MTFFYAFLSLPDNETVVKQLEDVNVINQPLQCGINYRESENHMFATGLQPYVVRIQVESGFRSYLFSYASILKQICNNNSSFRRTQCVGTLISPQHILTLANCFYAQEDVSYETVRATYEPKHLLCFQFRCFLLKPKRDHHYTWLFCSNGYNLSEFFSVWFGSEK